MASSAAEYDHAGSPYLLVRIGGQPTQKLVLEAELSIGRAEGNDLRLTDPKVSRYHARVIKRDAIPSESARLICASPPQVAQAKLAVIWSRSASRSHWMRSSRMHSNLRLSSALNTVWLDSMPVPLTISFHDWQERIRIKQRVFL